jgi:hypothetical protein
VQRKSGSQKYSPYLHPILNHLQKPPSQTAPPASYSPAMATDAQNEANRRNAEASTGPTTPEGKSTSSRNAVSHGLFSNFPEKQPEFQILSAAMLHDLVPEGILEQTLAKEITRAAWRLRRCAKVEDELAEADPYTDAMASSTTCGTQKSVDRARLETHRILNRTMAELRRLQNERRFRIEILLPEFDKTALGLTSYKDLMPAFLAEKRMDLLKRKQQGLDSFENMLGIVTGPPTAEPAKTPETKQTQSEPAASQITQTAPAQTPRNAPCPCGSNEKYKRCCGKNAPAVLGSSVRSGIAQAA